MISLNKPVPGVTQDWGVAPAGEDWGSLLNDALDVLADAANNVPATVGTEVAAQAPGIMATDPTIQLAAVAAVNGAVNARDFVQGSSARLVADVEPVPGKVFQPTDAHGNPLWFSANDVNGGPDRDASDAIAGAATQSVDEPGVSVMVSTASGNRTVLEANDSNGGFTPDAADLLRLSVPASRAIVSARLKATRGLYVRNGAGSIARMTPDPSRLVVHGESHADRPWVGLLATLMGSTYTNLAIGGMSGDMVALRAGALTPYFTVTGGALPASGDVTLTESTDITWRINVAFTMPAVAVTDGGVEVPGTFWRSAETTDSGLWTFTRTTPGSAITTTRVLIRSTNYETYSEYLPIVLFGRNDWELVVNGVGVPGGDAVSTAITATAAIVGALQTAVPRVLLLGTIGDTTYARGTSGYTFVTDYNAELWRCWPDFALPPGSTLRDYINSPAALTDAGLTPTTADTQAMLNDSPAPQIMADTTHWSTAAQPGVAAFVHNAIITKGWQS